MENAPFLVYLCTKFRNNTRIMKFNLQIITAAVLAIGGLVLLFCGIYIEPQGEIHDSLLIGFGEVATFAGALFGIDAAYSKKLWDITNSFANRHKAKPSRERSAQSNTHSRGAEDITTNPLHPLPPPSKMPTT